MNRNSISDFRLALPIAIFCDYLHVVPKLRLLFREVVIDGLQSVRRLILRIVPRKPTDANPLAVQLQDVLVNRFAFSLQLVPSQGSVPLRAPQAPPVD